MNKKMNTSYGHLFLFLSEFTFLVLKLVYRKRAIWKGVCAQMSIFERYTPLHAQAGPNFPLKILDTEPAQRPMRVDLSWLEVEVAPLQVSMGRWTGIQKSNFWGNIFFWPRYDSDGNYLGSLPDIATPRSSHTCARFFTNEGEQVTVQKLHIFCLFSKRPCWLLEVSMVTIKARSQAQSCTCPPTTNGQEQLNFPGTY